MNNAILPAGLPACLRWKKILRGYKNTVLCAVLVNLWKTVYNSNLLFIELLGVDGITLAMW